MNKKTFILFALLASVGCYHDKKTSQPVDHPLDGFGHEQVMMQIICCNSTMKLANADHCAALKAAPTDQAITFNGIVTTMTTDAVACTGLDETPFWGSLQ